MKVEYEQYVRGNRVRFMTEVLKHGESKLPSRRRRDEDEEKVLTHLDMLRWRRMMEKGKIVYLGGGTYRISIEASS